MSFPCPTHSASLIQPVSFCLETREENRCWGHVESFKGARWEFFNWTWLLWPKRPKRIQNHLRSPNKTHKLTFGQLSLFDTWMLSLNHISSEPLYVSRHLCRATHAGTYVAYHVYSPLANWLLLSCLCQKDPIFLDFKGFFMGKVEPSSTQTSPNTNTVAPVHPKPQDPLAQRTSILWHLRQLWGLGNPSPASTTLVVQHFISR